MVFDSAPQGGDCPNTQIAAPSFNTYSTDTTTSVRSVCDTTSNTAVNDLPSVELSGLSAQTFRGISSTTTGLFAQQEVNPNPQVIPQPGPSPFQPGPNVRPGDQPILPNPIKPGDQPLQPGLGPFAPAPVQPGGFTIDQVQKILADRDKAIALNRGQKPSDRPGGNGPLPPSPDGRSPFFPNPKEVGPRPDNPQPNKPRPEQVEFTKFNDAVKAAIDSGRPLVISFEKPGCGACDQLNENAWPSQQNLINDNAIRVKVNGSQNRSLANQFRVSGYPTTLVVKPGGEGSRDLQVIDRRTGSMSAEDLSDFLQKAFRGGG